MKKKLILSIFFTLCSAVSAFSADSSLFGGTPDLQIIVNNRILAKVNGKAISVMDLTKKMDMNFYRQFPEYATSMQARYQYYQANWKHVLGEIIDKELILIDAEDTKLQVSGGDVRQEMESLFGPNIIANLDKIGLTFDEAYKMVKDDIVIRRMLYFRVQSKALAKVTPIIIRNYYEEIAKNNIRDNEWVYNVITIRHRDQTKAAERANIVHRLLAEDKIPLAELNDKLKETIQPTAKDPTISISEEFHTKEKELSDSFKKTLIELTNDSYSTPFIQKSRADNSTLVRIFYLKNMVPGGVIPYNELEGKLKISFLMKK